MRTSITETRIRAVHFVPSYLLSPTHPVTVNVIGAGGTGSKVITQLALMHQSLVALGHPGLYVRLFDNDIVTEANLARQMFARADIDQSKARILISRINRFFGLQWEALHERYCMLTDNSSAFANFTLSCTDTSASRVEVAKKISSFRKVPTKQRQPFMVPLYWMDFGNSLFTGQVIMGTCWYGEEKQPESESITESALPNLFDIYPHFKKQKDPQNEPSCSLAEALGRQDLFVNSMLAQLGCKMLWDMFRHGKVDYHGVYLNLQPLSVATLPIFKQK